MTIDIEEVARAATAFSEVANSGLWGDVAVSFGCSEAEALADLLIAVGLTGDAHSLLEYHATDDDWGDAHYVMIGDVYSIDEARDKAIKFSNWEPDTPLSMSEVAEWTSHFEALGERWDLTDEFKENGII